MTKQASSSPERDNKDVKVLRHKDTKLDLRKLFHEGGFEDYQNKQSRDVFGEARYIISFIAERHNYARFVGVWEVVKKRRNNEQ